MHALSLARRCSQSRRVLRRGPLLRGGQIARGGTTIVETAVILPVFLFLFLSIIEFGHAQMVAHLLNSGCRVAARIGSTEGTTTADVLSRVNQTLGSAVDPAAVSVFVKDADVFDSASPPPTTGAGLEALPDLEVAEAEPRQMFVVRARVAYNDIALVPMAFMDGVVLEAQAFMRHE